MKAHYCGAPLGSGPEDGCGIRAPKIGPNIHVTAAFECTWAGDVRSCQQHGQPSAKVRAALIGGLHKLGLPINAREPIYFTVWQPQNTGWSLVEAYYSHIVGESVKLCQLVGIVDRDGRLTVVRRVRFQEQDVDKNTAALWSPLDLADADGDGEIDIVLQGDAYENHWIEVVRMKDGFPTTIFSGLGYYL